MSSKNIYDSNFFIDKFLQKLGTPNNFDNLSEYINTVFSHSLNESSYSEVHHILPRCIFPEFVDCEWNLIRLNYEYHILVHKLLSESYPIKQFLNPLRFMKENVSSEIHSMSSKSGWIRFKNNTEKYNRWKEKRSKHCSDEMLSGKAKHMSSLMWSNQSSIDKHKQSIAAYWTEDARNRKSIIMKEVKNRPEEKIKSSVSSQTRWDNMETETREKFNETMRSVNSSDEKRKKNSETAKENWKDPNWKQTQLLKRAETKQNKLDTGIELKTNSSSMKEKWSDPVWKANALLQRKLKREQRKKNETK